MKPTPLPHPNVLASDQIGEAHLQSLFDLSIGPKWRWPALHRLVGTMVPGDLIVVAAATGNGKTSFMLSELDDLARLRVPTLYVPLELEPHQIRRQWACVRAGYAWEHVARNDWARLPDGAEAKLQETHIQQIIEPVQFLPGRRCTLDELRLGVAWAVKEIQATTVMLDHIHRLAIGNGNGEQRVAWTDLARALKDLAREHEVTIIAAAQLNRSGGNVLDHYMAPHLDRIKEASAIAEEADVVLVLSRALKDDVKVNVQAIKLDRKNVRDIEEPNVMRVTCRKHRLLDSARDRTVRLHCENGFVSDMRGDYDDDPR